MICNEVWKHACEAWGVSVVAVKWNSGLLMSQGGEHCYYQGRLRDLPESWAAVSTCHGLWWVQHKKCIHNLKYYLPAYMPVFSALHLTDFGFLVFFSGMFSDGFFSYGIEPVHNRSNQVNNELIWVVVVITKIWQI